MKNKNLRVFSEAMPMNLQFFAEPGEGGADPSTDPSAGSNADPEGTEPKPLSFDEFLKDPNNQSEFDKRVAKALETNRAKMQQEIETKIAEAKTEAEKMAKMNAEQKAQYEREKRENELNAREAEIQKRELTAVAKEQLAEKGLPISLSDILNYTSAEECTASIEAVGKAFQEAVEKAVTDRLAGGSPQKKAPTAGATFTMEQIKGMSPAEINANWEAVQAAMQNNK